jgi:hypothetical protein
VPRSPQCCFREPHEQQKPGFAPLVHSGRLRLSFLDLKDEDTAIAAAVRVPVCCDHGPVSAVGIGGSQALGLLVVRSRIADERRQAAPIMRSWAYNTSVRCVAERSHMALAPSLASSLALRPAFRLIRVWPPAGWHGIVPRALGRLI